MAEDLVHESSGVVGVLSLGYGIRYVIFVRFDRGSQPTFVPKLVESRY